MSECTVALVFAVIVGWIASELVASDVLAVMIALVAGGGLLWVYEKERRYRRQQSPHFDD